MAHRLAPGHILQFHYLKKRLSPAAGKTFVEVGAGNGMLSGVLLELEMTGRGFDLNASACENNRESNAKYISAGKYSVSNCDFNSAECTE